jgi:hypothetical protein
MSKSNTFENEIQAHIFRNADVALIGDATGLRGSTTVGSLFVSLHTANPGETGNQSTSEANYTGYARIAVVRSAAGWALTAETISNAAAITFAECTAGSNSITHFGIGTTISGTGKLLYYGTLTTPLAVSTGVTPQFAIGQLTIAED